MYICIMPMIDDILCFLMNNRRTRACISENVHDTILIIIEINWFKSKHEYEHATIFEIPFY